MEQQILDLAKKLITIPSTSDNKDALVEALTTAKNLLPEYPFDPFASENIPSLLFSNNKVDNRHYKIILNAHLDVVPGTSGQFNPVEKDGKLFGRGAYDMKSASAIMILLFKEIGKQVNYPLGLQITTDEEVGGANGTVHQINKGVRAEFVITGEGTNFNIVNESKAKMTLKLTASGKTSHGAYPWLGDNAVWKMQQAIARLYETYPSPKTEHIGTTINVASIHTTNQAHNKTPDSCEAIFDARVIPVETNTFLEKIHQIVNNEIEVSIISDTNAHKTNPDLLQIQKLKQIIKTVLRFETSLKQAHGVSDIRHYTAVGCDGIEFGPVGGNHHADDEWIDIKSIFTYYQILKEYLLSS